MKEELEKIYESKKTFEALGIPITQQQLQAIKCAEQRIIKQQLFPMLKVLVEEKTKELQGELHISIHRFAAGNVEVRFITKQESVSDSLKSNDTRKTISRQIKDVFPEPVHSELIKAKQDNIVSVKKEKLNSKDQITKIATKLGKKINIKDLYHYFDNVVVDKYGVHPGQGLRIGYDLIRSDDDAFYPNGDKKSWREKHPKPRKSK